MTGSDGVLVIDAGHEIVLGGRKTSTIPLGFDYILPDQVTGFWHESYSLTQVGVCLRNPPARGGRITMAELIFWNVSDRTVVIPEGTTIATVSIISLII